MLNEADILHALRDCYDASHPHRKSINIVDLGLVDSIALTLDHDAPGSGIPGVPLRHALVLTLLAPTEDEAAQSQLAAVVSNRLAGLPELCRIQIYFAPTPPWTSSRISPAGRQFLGLDFPILNNRR